MLLATKIQCQNNLFDSLKIQIQNLDGNFESVKSFENQNLFLITNYNTVSVGDLKSGKLLLKNIEFGNYRIDKIFFVDSLYCYLSVSKQKIFFDSTYNKIHSPPIYIRLSNIVKWNIKKNQIDYLFNEDISGFIVSIVQTKDSILLATSSSLTNASGHSIEQIDSKIYSIKNNNQTSELKLLDVFNGGFYGIQEFKIVNDTIKILCDFENYFYDKKLKLFKKKTDSFSNLNYQVSNHKLDSDLIAYVDTNHTKFLNCKKYNWKISSWKIQNDSVGNDILNLFNELKLDCKVFYKTTVKDFNFISICPTCIDTIIYKPLSLVKKYDFGIESIKKIISKELKKSGCQSAFVSRNEIGWHTEIGLVSRLYYFSKNKISFINDNSGNIYFYPKKKVFFIDEYLNVISAQISNSTLKNQDTIAINCHEIFRYKDDIFISGKATRLNDYGFNFHFGENLIGQVTKANSTSLLILDNNGFISFCNNQNVEKLMLKFFPRKNWLIKLPNSPYYMCSKDASKMLHYVTPSLKVIGFEQLDPVYNRPDIVLDSIGKYFGGADAELVANYRESWEKRITKLGLDKEKLGKGELSVPSAEILNAEKIANENKAGKVTIDVNATDPKYTLRRFNVFVNEVPLYGSMGISITQIKKQKWDTTLSVPLSLGENKIQVSVMNELGLENFKYPVYLNYIPEKNNIVTKTHYIGIGVNEFEEKTHNLTYCVKDVKDLANAFSEKNTKTKIFTNKEVTRENILKIKKYLRDSTSIHDRVIISCSSHGLLDDSLNFYLATHDVDFQHPEKRGIKYEELEDLLDSIPARKKLLLLDACNSGENDKIESIKKDIEKNSIKMDNSQIIASRGIILKIEEENQNKFQKMNELFVNVRNNTGSVIISAAGGQQSALEAIEVDGKKIENGAFTYSVLEYLNKNKSNPEAMKVSKLKQYVEDRVQEITNGKQKPTSRQETMDVDWEVR